MTKKISEMSREDLERIVKCTVAWNLKEGNPVQFDKKFLSLYDNVEVEYNENEKQIDFKSAKVK